MRAHSDLRLRHFGVPLLLACVALLFSVGMVPTAHADGDVLFEISGAATTAPIWGRETPSTVYRIAQEYRPALDQRVGSVKHSVHASSGTTDSIVLSILEGGLTPEAGTLLRQITVASADLPVSGYATFKVQPSLLLHGGQTYWFMWSRTSPGSSVGSPGYQSDYRTSDQASNSAYWQLEGFAFVGGYGWKKYVTREWSFRLESADESSTVIAEQADASASITARGVCQSFTGLSGDLAHISIRVRFLQTNSQFYPATSDIGINGAEFGAMLSADCSGNWIRFNERRQDGRPVIMSGYDPGNTADFQTLVFTPVDAAGVSQPIPLDPSHIYEFHFILQSSAQRFEIQGSTNASSYPGGSANFINPFTPWGPAAVKDIYFRIDSGLGPAYPLYKQYDPEWAADSLPPYGLEDTIQKWGCAISSMAMVARSYGVEIDPDGNPVNPHFLNLWMATRDPEGYGVTGDLGRWDLIGEYTGYRVKYLGSGSGNLAEIEDDLATGNRPILKVRNRAGVFGHFVMATAQSGTTLSSIHINDPGYAGTQLLGDAPFYGEVAPEKGSRRFGPGPAPPYLQLRLLSPAEMLVTDPLGRRVGVNPVPGDQFEEIPGGSYWTDSIVETEGIEQTHGVKALLVQNPVDGVFEVEIAGTGVGEYSLLIDSFAEGAPTGPTIVVHGVAGIGSLHELHVAFESGSGQPPIVEGADPIAVAGPDIHAECQGVSTAVQLTAAGSSSPTGEALTYEWFEGSTSLAAGLSPTVNFALGTHAVSLRVTTTSGKVATDALVVDIVDTLPPTISSVSATPTVLWPPNKRMVAVTVAVSVTDLCDPAPIERIVSVSSSEGGSEGSDWIITGDLTVDLRADRSGKSKTGRVYSIVIRCTDAHGNESQRTVEVAVPHN